MPRIRWRDFSKGLWLVGPAEDTPDGHLRRAKGVAPLRSIALRSRSGTLQFFALAAHSMTRYNGEYVIGSSMNLYTSVARAIGSEVLITGPSGGGPTALDGTFLTFVQMPPTAGKPDYLFVAGGGSLQKLGPAASGPLTTTPTRWGISPPDYLNGGGADTALALNAQQSRIIDDLEDINDAGSDWNETGDDTAAVFANDAVRFTQGTASMRFEIGKDKSVEATRNFTLGGDAFTPSAPLHEFAGPITSYNEDFISFDIRINRPKHIKSIGIAFDADTSGGLFRGKFFSRDLKVQVVRKAQRKRLVGTGDILRGERVTNKQKERDFVTEMSDQLRDRSMAEFLGDDTIAVARRRWTRVTLPKVTFETSGDLTNDNTSWSAIRAVRVSMETNKLGGANVNWDKMRMLGGTGMLGDYQYEFTFKNSTTGTRSNPDLTVGALTIKDVQRQAVNITNIPQAPLSGVADPQVDKIEIWRTLGNGEVFFRVTEVNTVAGGGSASYTDTTADYIGMAEGATSIFEDVELPLDNIIPDPTFEDAVGPYLTRMWWTRDTASGKKGRVYFSPTARAEAVEGFIDIAEEDVAQKLVIWNDQLWLFASKGVYRVEGTDQPFVLRPVFGAPGTIYSRSVAAAPEGLLCFSQDGVRLFDGLRSGILGEGVEPLAPIFRNGVTDGLGPFAGIIGEYGRGEYYISDSTTAVGQALRTTLAVSREGAWRNLGHPFNFLFYDVKSNILFGANTVNTVGDVSVIRSSTHTSTFTLSTANFHATPGGPARTGTSHTAVGVRCPRAITITRLSAVISAAPAGDDTVTLKFAIGGVAQSGISLLLTSASAINAAHTATGTVTVAQDDILTVTAEFANGGTSQAFRSIAFTYDIVPE